LDRVERLKNGVQAELGAVRIELRYELEAKRVDCR